MLFIDWLTKILVATFPRKMRATILTLTFPSGL